MGGSFTVSNLGMYGTQQFAAIINPPQVGPKLVVEVAGCSWSLCSTVQSARSCSLPVLVSSLHPVKPPRLQDPQTTLSPHLPGGGSSLTFIPITLKLHLIMTLVWRAQAGILAVGGAQQRVELEGGQPVARSVMTVTLSADHRLYDGELAGRFLRAFKAAIESPTSLLV